MLETHEDMERKLFLFLTDSSFFFLLCSQLVSCSLCLWLSHQWRMLECDDLPIVNEEGACDSRTTYAINYWYLCDWLFWRCHFRDDWSVLDALRVSAPFPVRVCVLSAVGPTLGPVVASHRACKRDVRDTLIRYDLSDPLGQRGHRSAGCPQLAIRAPGIFKGMVRTMQKATSALKETFWRKSTHCPVRWSPSTASKKKNKYI